MTAWNFDPIFLRVLERVQNRKLKIDMFDHKPFSRCTEQFEFPSETVLFLIPISSHFKIWGQKKEISH